MEAGFVNDAEYWTYSNAIDYSSGKGLLEIDFIDRKKGTSETLALVRVFENPLTENKSASIIQNDEGELEDECACMGQHIMEWGNAYLYNFIGKYACLLEVGYRVEERECCWE